MCDNKQYAIGGQILHIIYIGISRIHIYLCRVVYISLACYIIWSYHIVLPIDFIDFGIVIEFKAMHLKNAQFPIVERDDSFENITEFNFEHS